MGSLLAEARAAFHRKIVQTGVLILDAQGVASNADRSQATSKRLAGHIAQTLQAMIGSKLPPQSAGNYFELAVHEFLVDTFPVLQHLRPGQWSTHHVGTRRGTYHLSQYVPYRHLSDLAEIIERSPTLVSVLGNSYDIAPDILVVRTPEPDEMINANSLLVDEQVARHTPLRSINQPGGIVHAVVSCKWTIRSDRAQNARSEALNVIRNRKGRTPHIAVVTGEPTPSRIASLAMGTGDIDMVYHFALPELVASAKALNSPELSGLLESLIDGERLRDISDLPVDLAI